MNTAFVTVIPKFATFSKNLLAIMILSCSLGIRHNMYLVFSAFPSKLTSLPASDTGSVLFFMITVFWPSKLTESA
jgi:hypothetical protein